MIAVVGRIVALACAVLAGAVLAPAGPGSAAAQELPFQGPLKILAGFAAGGQSDILARVIADKLKDRIGRPVLVENKTGAGGRIAVEAAKVSPADGSVIVLANISHMGVAPLIYPDLPYDPRKDFTPICKVVDFQIVMATGKQTGARDMAGVLEWLKANPGKGTSGHPGTGSVPHLYGLELASTTGLTLQPVPYRGGAPIISALTQGELTVGWAGLADFIEQHRAGQLHIVAVTGTARSPQLPDVPTFSELGLKSVEPNGWLGFFGPAGLLPNVAALYEREINAVLRDGPTKARLEGLGLIITGGGPAELRAQVESDLTKWKPVVDKAGIKP